MEKIAIICSLTKNPVLFLEPRRSVHPIQTKRSPDKLAQMQAESWSNVNVNVQKLHCLKISMEEIWAGVDMLNTRIIEGGMYHSSCSNQ